MVSFPPCKINLGLNVVAKRSDGYHTLSTCFYPIPWTDALEIIPADTVSFTSSGIIIPGDAADNLCMKAYQLIHEEFGIGAVKIHLHKIIPSGAGLGGGSSDAAHTLRLLNTIFNLQLSIETLKTYALKLGSDCPFFMEDKPMLGSGRGEILAPTSVNLNGKFIVLVKPDVHVSTAEAYAGVKPNQHSKSIHHILEEIPVKDWKNHLINDFEESVFKKFPIIHDIKQQLYNQGALYASMSGSGSAVYGIFDKPVDLKKQFSHTCYWSKILS